MSCPVRAEAPCRIATPCHIWTRVNCPAIPKVPSTMRVPFLIFRHTRGLTSPPGRSPISPTGDYDGVSPIAYLFNKIIALCNFDGQKHAIRRSWYHMAYTFCIIRFRLYIHSRPPYHYTRLYTIIQVYFREWSDAPGLLSLTSVKHL